MPQPQRMTLQAARAAVRPLGYTLTKNRTTGDYRLAPATGSPKHKQERAYFTNDLADAVATAAFEARTEGMR